MYVINPEVGIISYYRVYLGGLSLYSLLDPLYSLYTPTSSLTPPSPLLLLHSSIPPLKQLSSLSQSKTIITNPKFRVNII